MALLNVGLQQGGVVNVGVKFKRRWTLCHSGQVIVRFKCRRWTLCHHGQVIVGGHYGGLVTYPVIPVTALSPACTRWCLLQALNCQKSSWKTIFKYFKVDIDFAFWLHSFHRCIERTAAGGYESLTRSKALTMMLWPEWFSTSGLFQPQHMLIITFWPFSILVGWILVLAERDKTAPPPLAIYIHVW